MLNSRTMAGCALALAVAMSLAAPPAAAAPSEAKTAALQPVDFQGLGDASREDRFSAALREGLERSLRIVEDQGQASYRIAVSIHFTDPDYELSVEAKDATGETVVARAAQTCELCGLEEAVSTAQSLAATLATKVAAAELDMPTLGVMATPDEVVIAIDGEVVGSAPLTRRIDVGPHRVDASKSGFIGQSRDIIAVAGVHETIGFELEERPSRKPRTALGWAAVGVGGGALATGVTFIAIHATDVRLLCSGANVDADGDCRFVHQSRGLGIGIAAAGAALVATGLVLALRRHRTRRAK